MILELQLVPATAYGHNLRNMMTRYAWNKLSKELRDLQDHRCEVCSYISQGGGDLHLHEVWKYDDINHIQILEKFEVICRECHNIHHWGRTINTYDTNYVMRLAEHAANVNQITVKEFGIHITQAFIEWEKRSLHEWTIDLGDWSDIIKKKGKNK